MQVYVGRPVQIMTALFTALSLFATISFWTFMDKFGFRQPTFDYALGVILILVSISLCINAYNFFSFPSLTIEQDRILLQNFPRGKRAILLKDLKGIKQSYLGLSPMLELEYQKQGRLSRTIVAAESAKQNEVIRLLNK
ncbi:MAG: hypothetical protein AB7N80_13010 [Bdellovibrionales bacterium]